MTITLTCTNTQCPNHGTERTLYPDSPTPGVIAMPDYYCAHCGDMLMETSRRIHP